MASQSSSKNRNDRLPAFDSLRGFAMILMAIYHFSFDLNQFGIFQADMNNDLFWLNFRAVIMTLFTGLVGVGLFLSGADFQKKSFRKRLIKIGLCALAISVGTYLTNPIDWIYFGILHFIFLATILGPRLIRFPNACLLLGSAFVILPMLYRDHFFNRGLFHLTGLSPYKPLTQDFSPLFPWLGVVMLGIFIGYQASLGSSRIWQLHQNQLSFLGKHSLVFYMSHQIVLYPLAWLISSLI